MKARIHRGAREIGGSCVELESEGQRIVLDVGLPLDGRDTALPDVPGLKDGEDAPLCVIVSHAHPDHYGLAERVAPSIPILIGEAAQRILKEAAFFSPFGVTERLEGRLRDGEPFQVDPFTITPLLVDHSAFDAYALVADAEGQRLLYTGDLRAHGRKAGTFERMVNEPPAKVDTLLLEGTRVSQGEKDGRSTMTEEDVEHEVASVCRETDGAVLACYSPQNVDRLVSFYKAARNSGRELVMDLYAAAIAAATGNPNITQGSWPGVRVYVPESQRRKVKRTGEFDRVNAIGGSRIKAEELAERASSLVVTFRISMLDELARAGVLHHAQAVWSMWRGYLEQEGDRTRELLAEVGVPLRIEHASGHATAADLQELAQAVKAKHVVPIHTVGPERFMELFDNVEPHTDGEWWQV